MIFTDGESTDGPVGPEARKLHDEVDAVFSFGIGDNVNNIELYVSVRVWLGLSLLLLEVVSFSTPVTKLKYVRVFQGQYLRSEQNLSTVDISLSDTLFTVKNTSQI